MNFNEFSSIKIQDSCNFVIILSKSGYARVSVIENYNATLGKYFHLFVNPVAMLQVVESNDSYALLVVEICL